MMAIKLFHRKGACFIDVYHHHNHAKSFVSVRAMCNTCGRQGFVDINHCPSFARSILPFIRTFKSINFSIRIIPNQLPIKSLFLEQKYFRVFHAI